MSSPDRRLQVFLCHPREDWRRVRDLYQRLKTDGYAPWLDKEDLLGGANWRDAIEETIRTSDVFVACLSKHSPKEGFVQKELRVAFEVADEKPDGTIFIVPLKLEHCPVPRRLQHLQWLNLFESDGYTRLRNSLDARSDHLRLPRTRSRYIDEAVVPPMISVAPALDRAGLVLTKKPQQGAILNLDCRLENSSDEPVTVHRLEAWVTDPYNASMHMRWNLFYKTTGNLQTKTGDAGLLTLSPGDERLEGIQFVSPPSITSYRWSAGLYSLDLVGWIEPPRGKRPTWVFPYELHVDALDAERVGRWRTEYDAERDPDDAIAIPVKILSLLTSRND